MKLRALLMVAGCIASPALIGHQGEHGSSSPGPVAHATDASALAGPKEKAARLFFTDRKLMTSRGEEVEFFSDVLKDRVVLINFFFTHCADSCPLQSSKLSEVQALLGGLPERDVHLVSISVDPERDTPEEIKKYAEHFNAGEAWTFLTGKKEDVDAVVRRLGQLTPTAQAHTTLFILGNVRTGHWIKLHPDATPANIAAHLRTLASEVSPMPDAVSR